MASMLASLTFPENVTQYLNFKLFGIDRCSEKFGGFYFNFLYSLLLNPQMYLPDKRGVI